MWEYDWLDLARVTYKVAVERVCTCSKDFEHFPNNFRNSSKAYTYVQA